MRRAFDARDRRARRRWRLTGVTIADAAERVLRMPAVAGKGFLVTIGDRSVTGLVHRDQMVGPWQVPVADAGVTLTSYDAYMGEAMAMGERTPLALVDAPASGRMAVAEAITNIASARIGALRDVKLSANWMAAAGQPGQDQALFDTVRAVGMELCPALGIVIPVGKDSMSMHTRWTRRRAGEGRHRAAVAHRVGVRAGAGRARVGHAAAAAGRRRRTAARRSGRGPEPARRLGAGAGLGAGGRRACPTSTIRRGSPRSSTSSRAACADGLLVAYHDRSDGGLFATLAEMAFAGHCGLDVDVTALGADPLAALFSEELGAVLQVRAADVATVHGAVRGGRSRRR